MIRRFNCINPFEEEENPKKDTGVNSISIPYIAPSVDTILSDPSKILREISSNIQVFVSTVGNIQRANEFAQYEKKILPRQRDSWNILSIRAKEKMMHFWPDGLHKNMSLSKGENHTVHALLYALKTHKNGYDLLGRIITMTGTYTYGALFGYDILSMKSYAIPIEEFHSGNRPTKSITQLGDRVLALAYKNIEKDQVVQVSEKKIKDTATNITCPTEILLILLGKKFGIKNDLSDWKQGVDIGVFDYNANKSKSFEQPITKHIYIIKSYNPKTGIIRFCDAHNTKKSMKIDREIFIELPGLRIVYGNPEIETSI